MIYIYTSGTITIKEGKQAIDKQADINLLAYKNGVALLEIGSGNYLFTAEKK